MPACYGYAGMNPEHLATVIPMVMEEIDTLLQEGISEEELRKSKEQLKGNYILGLESTSSRMNSIGKSELLLGEIYTPEQILKKIDAVSLEGIREVMQGIFDGKKVSIAAVGNIKKEFDFSSILE